MIKYYLPHPLYPPSPSVWCVIASQGRSNLNLLVCFVALLLAKTFMLWGKNIEREAKPLLDSPYSV